MASPRLILFLFLLQLSPSLSSPLFLSLTKNPSTHNYLTRIYHGSNSNQPATLVLDLNSPFLHLDCSSLSTPITTLNCRSIQCTSATPNNCPPSPTSQHPCSLPTWSGSGDLVESRIAFSPDGDVIQPFLFLCVPHSGLRLPTGSSGVLGLGRTRIGPISQISHFFDHPKKFALCLSSKSGMISTGNDESDPFVRSMVYTPILETGDSSYSVPLKAVKLQNKKLLSLEEPSSVKLSTVEPYTKMVTAVYREIVRGFVTEAEALRMPRYPPQGGFEVCYGVEGSTVVPVIDLVLQSEMVNWRIYGHNSMVRLNDEVMCLGILDGGDDLGNGVSIVLGSHQLEDNLLDFDLGSSMLGFSSSLIKMQSSCAQLSLSVMGAAGGGGSGGGGGGGVQSS